MDRRRSGLQHRDKVAGIILRTAGIDRARQTSATMWEWNAAGSCQAPVRRDLTGKPDVHPLGPRAIWPDHVRRMARGRFKPPLHLELAVRCRRCAACRAARARAWTHRAIAETNQAARTWFGTLTFRSPQRFLIDCEAAQRIAMNKAKTWCYWPSRFDEFSRLNAREKFMARHQVAAEFLTKYFKRLRKQSGAKLRYLAVAEKHKDGYPHYHCLIHEVAGCVTERLLRRQWRSRHGSALWNVLPADDLRRVYYTCKYLSKEADARVRASAFYGCTDKQAAEKLSGNEKDETSIPQKPSILL